MKNKFSIVIPFYDEEKIIKKIISELYSELKKSQVDFEIIAVDNGSVDSTQKEINKLSKKCRLVIVKKNIGYGYGINQGLKTAKGSIIGFMDGDGQVSPKDLIKCTNYMNNNPSIDLCKVKRQTRYDGVSRIILSFFFNIIMYILFGIKSPDANACPKLMKKELYDKIIPIKSKDWFIDAEILIKSKRFTAKTHEIPILFNKRTTGYSKIKLKVVFEFLKNAIKARLGFFK